MDYRLFMLQLTDFEIVVTCQEDDKLKRGMNNLSDRASIPQRIILDFREIENQTLLGTILSAPGIINVKYAKSNIFTNKYTTMPKAEGGLCEIPYNLIAATETDIKLETWSVIKLGAEKVNDKIILNE